MYNQEYEDYMRSVLGYAPSYVDTTYRENNYYNVPNPVSFYNNFNVSNSVGTKYEGMYPEVYKVIYPLVLREAGMNSRSVTEDVIEEMVDRIYNEIDVKYIGNRSDEPEKLETKLANAVNKTSKSDEIKENRNSRPQNRWLRDLIKILLLREFIGGPNRPPRPPCMGPGPCPRPPFPGDPGMMPPPPPPRPRDYYA